MCKDRAMEEQRESRGIAEEEQRKSRRRGRAEEEQWKINGRAEEEQRKRNGRGRAKKEQRPSPEYMLVLELHRVPSLDNLQQFCCPVMLMKFSCLLSNQRKQDSLIKLLTIISANCK